MSPEPSGRQQDQLANDDRRDGDDQAAPAATAKAAATTSIRARRQTPARREPGSRTSKTGQANRDDDNKGPRSAATGADQRRKSTARRSGRTGVRRQRRVKASQQRRIAGRRAARQSDSETTASRRSDGRDEGVPNDGSNDRDAIERILKHRTNKQKSRSEAPASGDARNPDGRQRARRATRRAKSRDSGQRTGTRTATATRLARRSQTRSKTDQPTNRPSNPAVSRSAETRQDKSGCGEQAAPIGTSRRPIRQEAQDGGQGRKPASRRSASRPSHEAQTGPTGKTSLAQRAVQDRRRQRQSGAGEVIEQEQGPGTAIRGQQPIGSNRHTVGRRRATRAAPSRRDPESKPGGQRQAGRKKCRPAKDSRQADGKAGTASRPQ